MKGFLMFLLGLAAGALCSWMLTDVYYVAHPQWRHTQTVYDTLRYEMPIARDSTVVRYVVRTLGAAPQTPEKAPQPPKGGEEGRNTEEDSMERLTLSPPLGGWGASPSLVDVIVPIEEKVYEDSTYRIRISGYEARLEEVEIYRQTRWERELATPRPWKRWHLGVSAGAGYSGRGVEPYIGVGITYSIFSF